MPPKKKRERPTAELLTQERLVAAVRTLTAATACWKARAPSQSSSDELQAERLLGIVEAIEWLAAKQQTRADLMLGIDLREGFLEAYDMLAKRLGRLREADLAPGPRFDHMVQPEAEVEERVRQRLRQAWAEFTLHRYGTVQELGEDELADLLSPNIVEANGRQGPVDSATRAVAYMQNRVRRHRGCDEDADQGTGRTVALAAQVSRRNDWGYFFGAAWPVEDHVEAAARDAAGPLFAHLIDRLVRHADGRELLELLMGEKVREAQTRTEKYTHVTYSDVSYKVKEAVERERQIIVAVPSAEISRGLARGRAFDAPEAKP